MTSSAEESDVESLSSSSSSSSENAFIWEWQSNADPWDPTQTPHWTPYAPYVSNEIEEAKNRGAEHVSINKKYWIDLRHNIQRHSIHHDRQRPVRRRSDRLSVVVPTTDSSVAAALRQERLSSPLGSPVWCSSTTQDVSFYGSSFIHDWLMDFIKRNMRVKFAAIFSDLLDGLIKEGRSIQSSDVSEIRKQLSEIKNKYHRRSSKKKMAQLRNCCARIYSGKSFVHSSVNSALRNDDRTKLHTLGPFCYLLFNFIDRQWDNDRSLGHRLQKILRPNATRSMTLYRGDGVNGDCLEEYREAAGDSSKYFKWLPFISTSLDKAEAEQFANNALYIIEIQSHLTHEDRFANLTNISKFKHEKEILILPGVKFQVTKVESDQGKDLHRIYIKISSSYISKLQ